MTKVIFTDKRCVSWVRLLSVTGQEGPGRCAGPSCSNPRVETPALASLRTSSDRIGGLSVATHFRHPYFRRLGRRGFGRRRFDSPPALSTPVDKVVEKLALRASQQL